MPFKPVAQSLQDILDHIAYIQTSMHHVTLEVFAANIEKRAAVERWIQNITEAGFRLGDQAELLCPDIDWPNIRGLGNRLRHAYDLIDAERIFNIVRGDLPALGESALHTLGLRDAN